MLSPTYGPPPPCHQVRSAFRKLALTMHPDKAAGGSSKDARAAADAKFRLVQEVRGGIQKRSKIADAYDMLKDPDTKAQYDGFSRTK
eukprot:363443-Chlamydomonas_euryale.AAC.7